MHIDEGDGDSEDDSHDAGVDNDDGGGGGVMPYMDCIGMCRCEGYGFQAVYSGIQYINHSLSV